MPSLTIHRATPEDEAVVAEICRSALLPADRGDMAGLGRLLWHTDGVIGFVAERDGAIVGAVFGTVTHEFEGTVTAAVTLIAVAPGHSRRGIGTKLLAELESAVCERGATEVWSGGGQPRFWWSGVDEKCPAVIAFFEKAGYLKDDVAPNMRVALADADLGAREVGTTAIRRLVPSEWPAFREWMDQTWENQWGEEVTTTLDRTPVSCFVAVRDGAYIGFSAYDTNRRALFGPMGSSPQAREHGLGSELLRFCLRDYVDQGLTECEIGWAGPVDFYTKVMGAVVSRRFIRLKKEL